MFRIFFGVLIINFILSLPASAEESILAVQSVKIKPYEQALDGFRSACNSNIERIILTDLNNSDILLRINKINPDLILVIGSDALSVVKSIENIPIIFILVLDYQHFILNDNISGINMIVDPKCQFSIIKKVLPSLKNIGLIYDPANLKYFINSAVYAAKMFNVSLFTFEVRSPKNVSAMIQNMRNKIDAFWLLPDVTVVTPETVESFILFSLENKIPIIAFSRKYTELGALMSINIDPYDIGKQAGEMAEAILSGKYIKDIAPVNARKGDIFINDKIAEKLGVKIPNNIFQVVK